MIDYKTKLEYGNLVVEAPVKVGSKWEMKVTYEKENLLFKTPSLLFDKTKKTISFNSEKKLVFFQFIDDIETGVIEYLCSNSQLLFNGKVFTKERLKESLVTSWDVTDDGFVSLRDDCITSDTKILSQFDEDITIDKLSKNVICIMLLDSVTFQKDKFNINYTITHVKSKKTINDIENFFEYTIKETDMDFFNE